MSDHKKYTIKLTSCQASEMIGARVVEALTIKDGSPNGARLVFETSKGLFMIWWYLGGPCVGEITAKIGEQLQPVEITYLVCLLTDIWDELEEDVPFSVEVSDRLLDRFPNVLNRLSTR